MSSRTTRQTGPPYREPGPKAPLDDDDPPVANVEGRAAPTQPEASEEVEVGLAREESEITQDETPDEAKEAPKAAKDKAKEAPAKEAPAAKATKEASATEAPAKEAPATEAPAKAKEANAKAAKGKGNEDAKAAKGKGKEDAKAAKGKEDAKAAKGKEDAAKGKARAKGKAPAKARSSSVAGGAHASSTPLERAWLLLQKLTQECGDSASAHIKAEERVRVAEERARLADAALATARADRDALYQSHDKMSKIKRSVSTLMHDIGGQDPLDADASGDGAAAERPLEDKLEHGGEGGDEAGKRARDGDGGASSSAGAGADGGPEGSKAKKAKKANKDPDYTESG